VAQIKRVLDLLPCAILVVDGESIWCTAAARGING